MEQCAGEDDEQEADSQHERQQDNSCSCARRSRQLDFHDVREKLKVKQGGKGPLLLRPAIGSKLRNWALMG